MARGQDSRNHPNRRVGRSELPRLSEALANHLNDSMESHMDEYNDPEDFQMQHSMTANIGMPYGEPISELDAGHALYQYRKDRNSGKMDSESLGFYQDDIRDALRNR
jgi:hypothetical protein